MKVTIDGVRKAYPVEGGIYQLKGYQDLVLVVSSESNELYSDAVLPSYVLLKDTSDGLWSIPILINDVVYFARTNRTMTKHQDCFKDAPLLATVNLHIVRFLRKCCVRWSWESPASLRTLVNQVIEYSNEMKDLTGDERISTEVNLVFSTDGSTRPFPKAPKPQAIKTTSDMATTPPPKKSEAPVVKEEAPHNNDIVITLPKYTRTWSDELLRQFVSDKERLTLKQIRAKYNIARDTGVYKRLDGAKAELMKREKTEESKRKQETGTSRPTMKIEVVDDEEPSPGNWNPDQLPSRKKPELFWFPSKWSNGELNQFKTDLSNFSREELGIMYCISKPIPLELLDKIRQEILKRDVLIKSQSMSKFTDSASCCTGSLKRKKKTKV